MEQIIIIFVVRKGLQDVGKYVYYIRIPGVPESIGLFIYCLQKVRIYLFWSDLNYLACNLLFDQCSIWYPMLCERR